MATVVPTIAVQANPGLEITTYNPGLNYQAILRELGVTVFSVDELYYNASTLPQFNNPIQYSMFDMNANIKQFLVVTPIDPYQFVPSMYVKMRAQNIILDGQTGLFFDLNALQTVQFIFYANRKRNQDAIDRAGYINNFEALASQIANPGFYKPMPVSRNPNAPRPLSLIFTLVNHTTGVIPVTFLQPESSQNIANATTRYEWDLTGLSSVVRNGPMSIDAKFSPSQSLQTYNGTFSLINSAAQTIAISLNNMGIGAFWAEGSKVVTYNDSIIYANLGLPTFF